PNWSSPAADRGVPESTWHKPAGFEGNEPHRAHRFCKTPGVPGGLWHVEKIEQSAGADLRYVARQGTFERPFPRVRTLLGLLSACLIHFPDPGHGCDRGLSPIFISRKTRSKERC